MSNRPLENHMWPLGKGNYRNLGRSLPVAAGREETILEVKGGEDEYATYLTVTLTGPTPNNIVDFPDAQDPIATAIIDWGNAGHQARALVDFVQGTVVSVCASYVRIVARNDEDPNAPDAGTQVLGAFIGYLPRPGHILPPTLTQDGGTAIGAGATGTAVPIPPFASAFHVLARLDTPFTYAVEFLEQDATTLITRTRIVVGLSTQVPIPIPNGTRFVRVLNFAGSPDNINDVRFVFSLRL